MSIVGRMVPACVGSRGDKQAQSVSSWVFLRSKPCSQLGTRAMNRYPTSLMLPAVLPAHASSSASHFSSTIQRKSFRTSACSRQVPRLLFLLPFEIVAPISSCGSSQRRVTVRWGAYFTTPLWRTGPHPPRGLERKVGSSHQDDTIDAPKQAIPRGILRLSVRLLFVATAMLASANAPSRTRREALRGSLRSRAGHFAGPCRRQPIGVMCPLTSPFLEFRRVCSRTQLAVFVSIP